MFGTKQLKTFVALMAMAVAGMADAHYLPTSKEFKEIFESPSTAILIVDLQHCFGDKNQGSGPLAELGMEWRRNEMPNILSDVNALLAHQRSLPAGKRAVTAWTQDFHPSDHISFHVPDASTLVKKSTHFDKLVGAKSVKDYSEALVTANGGEPTDYHVPATYFQTKWPKHCVGGSGHQNTALDTQGNTVRSSDLMIKPQTSKALIEHDPVNFDDEEQMQSFEQVQADRKTYTAQLEAAKTELIKAKVALEKDIKERKGIDDSDTQRAQLIQSVKLQEVAVKSAQDVLDGLRIDEFVHKKGTNKHLESYSGFKNQGGIPTGLLEKLKIARPEGIKNIVVFGLVHDVCVFFTANDATDAFPDAKVHIMHELSAGFHGDLSFLKEPLTKMIPDDATKEEKAALEQQIAHTTTLHEFADIDVAKFKYANIGVNSLEYEPRRNKAVVETVEDIKSRFDPNTKSLKTHAQVNKENESKFNTWALINTLIASVSLLSVGALVMSNRKLQSKIHDLEDDVDDLADQTEASFMGGDDEYDYDGDDMA